MDPDADEDAVNSDLSVDDAAHFQESRERDRGHVIVKTRT
jgi:hypothetical protein